MRRACFLWLVLAVTAEGVRADDLADEADLRFQLGAERYTAGDYRGALTDFLASHRLVPNQNVVFNIARTYEKLQRYPEAFRYYEAALAGETDPAAKQRIERALAQIRPHVAVFDIMTEPSGATLYVDRRDLGSRGESPLALGLAPGRYTIFAELAGYHPARVDLEHTNAGVRVSVRLQLQAIVGTLTITGEEGAEVHLEGKPGPLCKVPCSAALTAGPHALRLTLAGHRDREILATVQPNQEAHIEATLDEITGTALITTDEPGALVEIDGSSRGFTPAIVVLPVGEHRLMLSAPGFEPLERTLVVTADRQVRVALALNRIEEVQAASRATEAVADAPSSVTVLTSEELRAFAYPTVADALLGVRGLYTWNDRSYASLGVRGLGTLGSYTNRELVLLDGHPTNDNWIGSAYVGLDGRTDLADLERIEIVRGPGSALYGANAFAGVINLVTRYEAEPEHVELGLSAVGPSVGRARARVQRQLGSDGRFFTTVAGAHGSGRDFYFPELSDPDDARAGYARAADGLQAATVQGRTTYSWATAQWFLHTHDKRIPTGEYDTLLGDLRTHQSDTRGFVEARAEPVLSRYLQVSTRLHWNLYRFRGDYARDPVDGGVEHDGFDGQWVGAEQRAIVTPTEQLRLTIGAEGQAHYRVQQRARDDAGYFLNDSGDNERTYQLGAAYAVADAAATPSVRFSAGLRLDAYSTFGLSLNPRAAVILRPYEAGNTKVLMGKAFRAPSVYELYYNDDGFTQIASPNLRPETLYSVEVEHTHRFSQRVAAVLALYTNYVTDLVVTQGSGDMDDPLQYTNSRTPLASLGSELSVRREWRQGYMLQASYSYQHARYLASENLGDLFSLDRAPNTREVANAPAHAASFKAAAPLLARALTLATRLTVEGPRYDRYETEGDPPQRTTDAFAVWDLVLSGHEQGLGLRYALGLYNVADHRYVLPVSAEFEQRAIVQEGRSLLANLELTL